MTTASTNQRLSPVTDRLGRNPDWSLWSPTFQVCSVLKVTSCTYFLDAYFSAGSHSRSADLQQTACLAVCLQLLVPDVTLLRKDVTGLKKTPPRPAKPYTSRLISKLCSTPVASHCEQNKRRRRAVVRVRSRWSSSAVSCPLWVALSSSVVVIACAPTKSPRASIKKKKSLLFHLLLLHPVFVGTSMA